MTTPLPTTVPGPGWSAVLRLPDSDGQGALVAGGLVLTAAHCIECESVAGWALGAHALRRVRTADGTEFRMQVLFLDPVSDLAVLGPADFQESPDDADAFERYADRTAGFELFADALPLDEPVPAFVYAHTGEITPATAERVSETANSVWVEAELGIRGGTSGGPIVSDDGRLLAIVSRSGGTDLDEHIGDAGPQPHPALCLPVWALRQISAAGGIATEQRKDDRTTGLAGHISRAAAEAEKRENDRA